MNVLHWITMNVVNWLFICFIVGLIGFGYGHKHGIRCMIDIMKGHMVYDHFDISEAIEYEEDVLKGIVPQGKECR